MVLIRINDGAPFCPKFDPGGFRLTPEGRGRDRGRQNPGVCPKDAGVSSRLALPQPWRLPPRNALHRKPPLQPLRDHAERCFTGIAFERHALTLETQSGQFPSPKGDALIGEFNDYLHRLITDLRPACDRRHLCSPPSRSRPYHDHEFSTWLFGSYCPGRLLCW